MWAKLTLLWAAGLTDLWATVTLSRAGALGELNPLAALFADSPLGLAGVKLASLGVLTGVLAVLWIKSRKAATWTARVVTVIEIIVAILGVYLVWSLWRIS